MIQQSFYTFLTGNATIAALCSSVYPQWLPLQHQGFPAISYTMDSDEQQPLLDGSVSSLKEALISVDVWSKSYLEAIQVAEAVSGELVGFTGTFGTNTVDQIRRERKIDQYENDPELFRVSMQFFVAYS